MKSGDIKQKVDMMRLHGRLIKVLTILAVTTAIVLGAFTCGKKDAGEIRIGVILPLTGDAAFYGQSVKQGLDFAASQINSGNGVKGAEIQLHYEDSRALPAEGVTAFQKLKSLGNINAIIGDAVSSVTLAFAPLAEKGKMVVMSPLSSAPAISNAGDYIFRNVPSDLINSKAAADYLINERHLTKLAVLFINNDFGVGLNNSFDQRVNELGGSIVAAESYDPGNSDFRTQLSKIAVKNPDAIFLVGYAELSQALVQAKEMGLKTVFMGTGLLEDPNLLKTARDAANGLLFTQLGYDPSSNDTVMVEFVDGFKSQFGEEPNIIAAYGYDALGVLASAMDNSDLTSTGIKNQLYAIRSYQGVTGAISFDQNGDVTQPMSIKMIENEKFVWVNDLANSNE